MVLRFFLVFVSLCLFITSSFLVFNFSSGLMVYSGSFDGSQYAYPYSPDEIQVKGTSALPPVVVDSLGDSIHSVQPSSFADGLWTVYPSSLEPGFYQVFSGFSQGFFQVGFSLLPPDSPSGTNPLFLYIFITFILSALGVILSFLRIKSGFIVFSKRNWVFNFCVAGFVLLTFLLGVYGFIHMKSLSFFTLKNSFSLNSQEFNVIPNAPLLNLNNAYPQTPSKSGSYNNLPPVPLSVFAQHDKNKGLSLSYLRFVLAYCIPLDESKALMYSNNSSCAATVLSKAAELYGPAGFNELLASPEAEFFQELCENSSRFSAKHFELKNIDYDILDAYSVCNFSWINHLLSSRFTSFASPSEFFNYGVDFCSSLKGFSNISEFVVQHQCLRGLGVGLYSLTKSSSTASKMCLGLPEVLDPGNCVEGVFLEAFRLYSARTLYNTELSSNEMSGFGSICAGVPPDFLGLCVRIIAFDVLANYSFTDFKNICSDLGFEYSKSCSTGLGHMAFLSFPYTDLPSLSKVCDNSTTSECFERFFFSHATSPEIDYADLFSFCADFVSMKVSSEFSIDSCNKLKEFVNSTIISKRPGG